MVSQKPQIFRRLRNFFVAAVVFVFGVGHLVLPHLTTQNYKVVKDVANVTGATVPIGNCQNSYDYLYIFLDGLLCFSTELSYKSPEESAPTKHWAVLVQRGAENRHLLGFVPNVTTYKMEMLLIESRPRDSFYPQVIDYFQTQNIGIVHIYKLWPGQFYGLHELGYPAIISIQ